MDALAHVFRKIRCVDSPWITFHGLQQSTHSSEQEIQEIGSVNENQSEKGTKAYMLFAEPYFFHLWTLVTQPHPITFFGMNSDYDFIYVSVQEFTFVT